MIFNDPIESYKTKYTFYVSYDKISNGCSNVHSDSAGVCDTTGDEKGKSELPNLIFKRVVDTPLDTPTTISLIDDMFYKI